MNHSSRKRYYTINLTAQATGRLFSIACNLAVFMIVARLLGAEKFGEFSYIIVFIGMCAVFAEFGTTFIFAKDIAQIGEDADIYWGNFIILRFCLSMAVAIPAIAVAYLVRYDLFQYLFVGILALPFIGSRFFDPLFQVYQKPWFSTVCSLTYASLYLASTFCSVHFFDSLWLVVVSYAISNIVYTILAFFLSASLLKPRFHFQLKMVKKILKLAWPIGIAVLIIVINTRADTFMLAAIKSDYEVGIYNAAYRFLDLAATFAVILVGPILPIFSKDAKEDHSTLQKTFSEIMERLAIILIPVALITPYISTIVIKLIFGDAFISSAKVLNILSWVGVLIFYSLFSSALMASIGVTHFAWWNAVLATTTNIVLNYIWIPKYSYIGSAWATLICEIILLGVTFFYIIRHLGNIFKLLRWIKIILASTMFIMILVCCKPLGNQLNVIFAVISYIPILFALRLIPLNLLFAIAQKIRGNNSSMY